MTIIYKCNGCGKEETGRVRDGDWIMPEGWLSRYDGFSFDFGIAIANPQIHICGKKCCIVKLKAGWR